MHAGLLIIIITITNKKVMYARCMYVCICKGRASVRKFYLQVIKARQTIQLVV